MSVEAWIGVAAVGITLCGIGVRVVKQLTHIDHCLQTLIEDVKTTTRLAREHSHECDTERASLIATVNQHEHRINRLEAADDALA